MEYKMQGVLWLVLIVGGVLGRPSNDQVKLSSSEEEGEQPKIPYSFSYAAARHYGGHPDREHKESRGPDGITRGVFRYVDPNLKVQEIVYRSDDDGFHVEASNIPEDTPVVAQAKDNHKTLFHKISEEHARIGEELKLLGEEIGEDEEELKRVAIKTKSAPVPVYTPRQSNAVAAAIARHQQLFNTISERNSKGAQPTVVLPKESRAVQSARRKHEQLFQVTVQDHAKISEELKAAQEEAEELAALEEQLKEEHGDDVFIPAKPYKEPEQQFTVLSQYLPKNTRALQARRQKHQELYNRIIGQHSRLAEEIGQKQE